jgi:hypothetical protein
MQALEGGLILASRQRVEQLTRETECLDDQLTGLQADVAVLQQHLQVESKPRSSLGIVAVLCGP